MDPWGQGAEGANEAKPPRSTTSGGCGKPGATKAAVALRRLPVSKEEFFVFSGIKQVFPSTYCVSVCASCNGEPSKGLFPAPRLCISILPAFASSPAMENDVSYLD